MTLELVPDRLEDYVSLDRGEVDRRIFSDEEIFEREIDLIFGRAWQFLCHETQIPKPGDFFETPIGRDNVLTVRQKDGTIKGLLNTCMHRGNAVCRAEEGNTKAFMCTYHGWTYDLAGNLIGVPDLDLFYKGDLAKEEHGLREVAQLASYHGFVFATMDETAPSLEEYLGPTGRLGIDLLASRDVEIVPGVQKFVIDCNWKLAVDNVFDFYHAQITHMSAMRIVNPGEGVVDPAGAKDTMGEDLEIPASGTSGSHDLELIAEFGHGVAGPSLEGFTSPMFDQTWRERPEVIDALGPIGVQVAGHPNLFPNAWVATTNLQLCLRVPINASSTEVWWFTFVEKDMSPEARAMTLWFANHGFGPAGLFEQEDGENWAQSTLQARGASSRKIPQLLTMDLGRGKVMKEHGLARIEGTSSEHVQLWMYHSWSQWMRGLDWDALRTATVPPDVL